MLSFKNNFFNKFLIFFNIMLIIIIYNKLKNDITCNYNYIGISVCIF